MMKRKLSQVALRWPDGALPEPDRIPGWDSPCSRTGTCGRGGFEGYRLRRAGRGPRGMQKGWLGLLFAVDRRSLGTKDPRRTGRRGGSRSAGMVSAARVVKAVRCAIVAPIVSRAARRTRCGHGAIGPPGGPSTLPRAFVGPGCPAAGRSLTGWSNQRVAHR